MPRCACGAAECYTFSDEEDEEDDVISDVETTDFTGDARKIRERLSVMFEHNDLINNRMAVLTKAIREGPLQPSQPSQPSVRRVRTSTDAAERGVGNADPAQRRASLPREWQVESTATQGPSQGLEERLQQLTEENAALRARVETMEQTCALNDEDRDRNVLREGGAEAARDFIQAMPGSTPTRKSVKMDAQEARSVAKGYLQETSPSGNDPAGGSELWNRARSALAASSGTGAGAEDRRNWRRELRLERAHRKRLEREMATLRSELAKCESIVEQLLEEIEEQTRSKGGSASSSLLEGKSHIAGKQKGHCAQREARQRAAGGTGNGRQGQEPFRQLQGSFHC